jgi:hypothetical protein
MKVWEFLNDNNQLLTLMALASMVYQVIELAFSAIGDAPTRGLKTQVKSSQQTIDKQLETVTRLLEDCQGRLSR